MHGRSLLQQDALSNSNGCLETIPKCEAGACATRNVRGVARWVCLRCLSNYEAVVDDSGQDNIIQCGEWAPTVCLHCQRLDDSGTSSADPQPSPLHLGSKEDVPRHCARPQAQAETPTI
jgi:hypothetical protein